MTALELSKKYKSLFDKHRINTPLRLAHFFAQLDHESGLVPKRENLN
jgi:putative chitinase